HQPSLLRNHVKAISSGASPCQRVPPHTHGRVLADMDPLPEPEPRQQVSEVTRQRPFSDNPSQGHLLILAARKAGPILPLQAAFVDESRGGRGKTPSVSRKSRKRRMQLEQQRGAAQQSREQCAWVEPVAGNPMALVLQTQRRNDVQGYRIDARQKGY